MRYHLKITDNDRLLLDIDLEESSPTQTPRAEAKTEEQHQHENGAGWLASAYVGPDAQVSGNARVFGDAQVSGNARMPAVTVSQRAPAESTLDLDVREHGPVTPSAITISGTGKKERLTVEWRQPGVTNTFRASCWASEKAIWPRVMERVKQPTVFLVKESKGYLNIVGVKSPQ